MNNTHLEIDGITCDRETFIVDLTAALASTSTGVTKLRISNYKLSESEIGELLDLVLTSKVTSLSFYFCFLNDEHATIIANKLLLHNCALLKLDLSYNSIECEGVRAIACILGKIPLRALNLSCNEFSDEGMIAITNNILASNIVDLRMSEASCSETTFALFCSHVQACPIVKLVIDGMKLTDQFVFDLASALSVHTVIKFLDLSNNLVTDVGARALAAMLPHTNIEYLNLARNKISNGFGDLFAVIPNTKISHLNISYQNIDEGIAQIIADCLPKSNLHSLVMKACGITDSIFELAIEAIFNSKISSLTLTNNKITSQSLEKIPHVDNMVDLILDQNKIDDVGIAHLKEIINFGSSLSHLSLNRNKITDIGAASIADILCLRKSSIVKLCLTGNRIGNAGLEQILKAAEVIPLEILKINENKYNQAGIKNALVNLSKLKIKHFHISIVGTPVSLFEAAIITNPYVQKVYPSTPKIYKHTMNNLARYNAPVLVRSPMPVPLRATPIICSDMDPDDRPVPPTPCSSPINKIDK